MELADVGYTAPMDWGLGHRHETVAGWAWMTWTYPPFFFPYAGGKERCCRRGRVCDAFQVTDRSGLRQIIFEPMKTSTSTPWRGIRNLVHSCWNSRLSESIRTSGLSLETRYALSSGADFIHWGTVPVGCGWPPFGSAQRMGVQVLRRDVS